MRWCFLLALIAASYPTLSLAAGARCKGEVGLRSIDGTVSTSITFANGMPIPLRVYWVNYQGDRQFYAVVGPHQSHRQQTYVTHPWIITDENEDCIAVHMPAREARRVLVTGQQAPAPATAEATAQATTTALPEQKLSKAAEHLVREQIASACMDGPGKIDPASVIEQDLTGDGKADLIIHHHGIECERGGRSSFCGAQQCSANLYVRRGTLLHPAGEFGAVEWIRIEGPGIPTIRTVTHGGKPLALRWNGREFGRVSAPPEKTTVTLDDFLGGLLPACEGSPEFNHFRNTLTERYGFNADGSRINAGRRVAIPASIRPLVGRAMTTNKGEFTKVVVPLTGKFRSLTVTALEFSFGNQNGINATAMIFAETPERVRDAIGTEVEEGAKRLKAAMDRGDAGGTIEINAVDNQTRLVCDVST